MRFNQGITLVEALVGITILGFILVFVMITQTLYFNVSSAALNTTKAVYLAEEGHEFVRYLRDEDWNQLNSLTTGTTYYFSVSGADINITATPEVIEGIYTRSFVLEPLLRDGNDDFVETGGVSDSGGRVVTVNVVWGSDNVSLKAIVSNIHSI